MGRSEASKGLAPASFRKDARAKRAKLTSSKTIPSLLISYHKARRGVDSAELIVDPPKRRADGTSTTLTKKNKGPNSADDPDAASIVLKLYAADSITAAQWMQQPVPGGVKQRSRTSKIGILNMASPLRPGGGFLNGAQAQEEFLCLRTTLLPSLKEEFYRLPEVGGVLTKDVLIFRDGIGDDLAKSDRFFVDIVSAGMLRFPDVKNFEEERLSESKPAERDDTEAEEDVVQQGAVERNGGEDLSEACQHRRSSVSSAEASDSDGPIVIEKKLYANDSDRQLVVQKMRAVMRLFQTSGATKVVLGAWGCGAYGNPVEEVAKAWKRVLIGRPGKNRRGVTEAWTGIEEVVFAIKDARMAADFLEHFGDGLGTIVSDQGAELPREPQGDQAPDTQELEAKIADLEIQFSQTRFADLKTRLGVILEGLKGQLSEVEQHDASEQ